MCEYCENKKSIKETESGSYYKIIGTEIEHHEKCMDSYYNFTEKIPINFCPMCGRLLKIPDIKLIDNGAGAMASASVSTINPFVPEKLTEIQKEINKAIEEGLLAKNTIIGIDFAKGGFSSFMRGGTE